MGLFCYTILTFYFVWGKKGWLFFFLWIHLSLKEGFEMLRSIVGKKATRWKVVVVYCIVLFLSLSAILLTVRCMVAPVQSFGGMTVWDKWIEGARGGSGLDLLYSQGLFPFLLGVFILIIMLAVFRLLVDDEHMEEKGSS